MRALAIAQKTVREMVREPLVTLFALGFPLALLMIYHLSFGAPAGGFADILRVLVLKENAAAQRDVAADSAAKRLVTALRDEKFEGKPLYTIVEVTDEAERVADRVAIIDHGKLLVLDTPEALKRSVGEGDVIEITVREPPDDAGKRAAKALGDSVSETSWDDEHSALSVRAVDAVGKLATILETLKNASLTPGEVRVRENTLEDVFIQLTGRSLRK